jgi:glucosamine--fructose-6-phosphate aminotransferase (isomerizing)
VRKPMEPRQQILEIPRALRETLEKGRPEYDALVRRTRWGEGPLYLCGCGASALVSLGGAYAFESLLGWPVVAREAKTFESYALSVLRPRSVVLIISASGEAPEALELARAARARGATVLALTGTSDNALARAADGAFLTRADPTDEAATTAVCQHAALIYVALVAAQVLKRHNPQWDLLEDEFEELPERVEWALAQLSDAIRSLGAELKGLGQFGVVGAGFYHAPAIRGAWRMKKLAGLHATGMNAAEFRSLEPVKPGHTFLLLSGSRAKMKRIVHEAAAQAKIEGARILSVTDSNDRELLERSEVAVLLPTLMEPAGATLTLALLEWLAVEASREPRRDHETARSKPLPGSAKDQDSGGQRKGE